MEVRLGYKQTEVGVIPGEWQAKPLGEGISLLSGHHVLAQHCNSEGRGKPYITGPADFPNGVIRNTKFTEKPSTLCRQGDILVTVKGSGAGTIVFADAEYCISRQLMAIRVSDWDAGYVYESLRRDASLFGAAATGLIPGLSRGDILDKKLAKPPLPEQRAIAAALSDVDALLTTLDQMIAKKRDLKQAAMQQLLTGKTRLPGFGGDGPLKKMGGGMELRTGYKHSDVGVIPEDWNFDYIENFSVITTGSKNTQDRIEDGQYPFFVRSQTVERINSYSFDGEAVLTAGDGVGTGKVFHYINGKFDVHQRVYQISDFAEDVNGYFFYLCFSTNFYNRIMQMTAKSSVDSVRRDMISRMQIALPPTEIEQTAIATILSDMDAELTALETRRDKTRNIKQAMMQELLTGKTRLMPKEESHVSTTPF